MKFNVTFEENTKKFQPSIDSLMYYPVPGEQGPKGDPGQDGITPHIGANGNWFIGETDTGNPSRGEAGAMGSPGTDGQNGQDGEDGGYYTPAFTQTDSTTMEVSFTPSKEDMPAVEPTQITIPVGTGGGESGHFYSLLSTAIADINSGTTENALTDSSAAKVKVSKAENGRTLVTLLDDLSESVRMDINADIDLVLNGKKLTLTALAALLRFGANTNAVIDGSMQGSSVEKTITSSNNGVSDVVASVGDYLKIIGGNYYSKGDYYVRAIAGTADIDLYGVNATAISTGYMSYALSNADGSENDFTVKNCTLNARGARQPTGIFLYGKSNAYVEDSTINAVITSTSVDSNACCIRESTHEGTDCSAVVRNSKLLSDGRGSAAGGPCGIALRNIKNLKLYNVTAFGTHSAVAGSGTKNLYIYGGTYTGLSHGGLYFNHGQDGIAYVNDALIRCGNYEGEFGHTGTGRLAACYIGGNSTEAASNMTIFVDNCEFDCSEAIQGECIVLRGTDGETNNTLNISNSTINGTIRNGWGSHHLNIGVNCNFTAENVTGDPNGIAVTGKLYRRVHEEKDLDGKDYNALFERIDNGGGSTLVDADAALSEESTNPVQNKVVTAALGQKLGAQPTDIPNGSDLNSITTPGYYKNGETPPDVANLPLTTGVSLFNMEVIPLSGGSCIQLVYLNNLSTPYRRSYNGTSWSSWTADSYANTTYKAATVANDGLLSSDDKVKLNGIEAGANKTVVDSELSDTSENPVQNKTVQTAIEAVKGDVAVIESQISTHGSTTYRAVEAADTDVVVTELGYIGLDGVAAATQAFRCIQYVPFQPAKETMEICLIGYTTLCSVAYYDENKVFLSGLTGTKSYDELTSVGEIPADTAYVGFSFLADSDSQFVRITGTHFLDFNGIISRCESPLLGKKLISAGDSITANVSYRPYGYCNMIAERNDMTFRNYSIWGATIAKDIPDTSGCILTAMEEMEEDADYVILSGGANDFYALGQDREVLGSVTEDYGSSFDQTTFCGAMESLCKQAIEKWIGKKILFVITHRVADITDQVSLRTYVSTMIGILEKWGIPYVDLFHDMPSLGLPALKDLYTTMGNTEYEGTGDGLHPNEDGYRLYYVPRVEAKLKAI